MTALLGYRPIGLSPYWVMGPACSFRPRATYRVVYRVYEWLYGGYSKDSKDTHRAYCQLTSGSAAELAVNHDSIGERPGLGVLVTSRSLMCIHKSVLQAEGPNWPRIYERSSTRKGG